MMAGACGISPYVAVRLEQTLGVDGRLLLLKQTLVEWERAKWEFGRREVRP